MTIEFEIPDESLGGLRTHLLSHGKHKANEITGAQEWVPEFASVEDYFAHVISEQIGMFNERHPQAVNREAALELKRVEGEMKKIARPKLGVVVDRAAKEGKGKK